MMLLQNKLLSYRVLNIVEVRTLCLPISRLHVAENNGAMLEKRLERPQADGVEVRVQAAEAVQVQVAHSVGARDAHVEGLIARQEPDVVLAHKALVFRVRPKHVRPVRETLAPRARPVGEAWRQTHSLPALVQNSYHWRRRCEGVPLFIKRVWC